VSDAFVKNIHDCTLHDMSGLMKVRMDYKKVTTNLTAPRRKIICSDFHLKSFFGSRKQSKNHFFSEAKKKKHSKRYSEFLIYANLLLQLSSKI
jgi:hypothetical protein